MPGWTLLDVDPTHGRTFHRPLDTSEKYYFWGGLCDGDFDCLFRIEIHLLDGATDAQLFSDANITEAWMSTKRRYPLVGATLGGLASPPSGADSKGGTLAFASDPHFVVRENDLAVLREREIVFGHVASAEEVDLRVTEIFDGPRLLSRDMLTQLHVLRETGKDNVLHVIILFMHCVTDVTASSTVLRCFLDVLARSGESEPAQAPLEDRLAMVASVIEREPIQLRSLSPARRRWQKAIASTIFQSRMKRMQGGHTLPCRLTTSTSVTPSRPREAFVFLTPAETAVVLSNCRRHNVTFGSAYLALSQVAMTRVLYRRYLRGDISEEEWEYRKEQPHIISGPFSLRPHLDKAWFEKGGGGESMVSLGSFFYQLPFMTLGGTFGRYRPCDRNVGLSNDAPSFSELLTFDRFLHRTEVLTRQAAKFFKHPLFLGIVDATSELILQYLRRTALERLERIEASKDDKEEDEDEDILTPMDSPLMLAHGGSSFGNLDSVLPLKYPIPSAHPLSPFSSVPHPSKAGYVAPLSLSSQSPLTTSNASIINTTAPKIVLQDIRTVYHSSPGELYLGAWSSGGRLRMYGIYDSNVFEPAVVKEWLDEIKGAVLWYLGQTHKSRWAQRDRGQFDARFATGEQAKL